MSFCQRGQEAFPRHPSGGAECEPYYTNSSQLPVGFTGDPFEALERQEALQRKYTGGTVLHLYMGTQLSSAGLCRKLERRNRPVHPQD
ncbi:hypothetical protein LO749_12180 [Paracoccus denitrificans]|nr:anaerobic ribonucleoside-triphosphate reductase [Paracoccus denitrificans]UFS66250.1 hypothetical protein LO749_12180 [Paracoccus denitrificans]